MRSKGKYIIKGALLGSGIIAISDILLQWFDYNKRGDEFTWENYDGKRTLKNSLIGASLGGGIGYLTDELKRNKENKNPFHSSEYLKGILKDEHLKADSKFYNNVLKYRKKVKEKLSNKFNAGLVNSPEDAGSFHKRTAIGSNYDLDIILPFHKNYYPTLENMYNDVFETIEESFSSNAKITKQKKSIGITFYSQDEEDIHFDIVPGREINNYDLEKKLNLYINPNWAWQKGSSAKSKVGIDKDLMVNKPKARRIVKLLKIYRDRNQLELPTTIIDQCVVAALSDENYGINKSDKNNLMNSMLFIAKNIKNEKIIDLSNSNNNLSSKLTDTQKFDIASFLIKDVNRIKQEPNYLKVIFES
ncbi:hypothetical protein [Polaribacter vadi]|uniref:hypothetical protein n=1 Tax=Polaribacter vadi TaxID=1774273 RepID=UPI0030EB194D|tara:strand:+ start:18704 stop:19783 length:1080 start_codon:yes stop_codon:yes gene_type:complete